MSHSRYAIYYLPDAGALAEFGAYWLGWDVISGQKVDQFDLPRLVEATHAPRKYGFHATLKPPFRLRTGNTVNDLHAAVASLAEQLPVARCHGLKLKPMGRFLALVPDGHSSELARVAAACVTALDDLRAPLSGEELERRRKACLTAEQDRLLVLWGYPYVLEAFRFHMTLTGRLPKKDISHWQSVLEQKLPPLSEPFELNEIALVGERADGNFELIRRCPIQN